MNARLTLIAASLLLFSCAPHQIQYYELTAHPPTPPTQPPAKSDAVLIVGRIAVPVALQDGRIHYREGANEVGAYEYHRWTDPPGIMVKDRLIAALRASGAWKSVEEASTATSGNYILRGKLEELSEIDGPGIGTRVSLDLELHNAKTGLTVWAKTISHDDTLTQTITKADRKKVSDVVASIDRDLQQVISEATAALASFIQSQPRS